MNRTGSSSQHPRPDCFGPFPVRAELGAGRFGPLYLGRNPSTNTRVVIRTFELSRELREFGEQSDLLDAFRKLCETTLDHPSLARPLAFGAEGDIPYLVYADLAGTAMDVVMRQNGARPVTEVLQRIKQLADAIDFAASAGVHHGMLAPCDVILEGERTGVTGIGLAQAMIKAGFPAEAGSPYASPQRLAGAPPTCADDIYSLAAISLELLIGTPRNPHEDTSRALREAQGLPERRRPRPAPHETRLFTTIAGVDAGKLRASFAAAFSEEPSGRPSTASEFVASFQDAVSRRVTDEPTPSVVAVPLVSDERQDPDPAPVLDVKPADDGGPLEAPCREERVVTEGRAARRRHARERRREKRATSQPLVQESHEPRVREPEVPARPEPIVDDALLEEVAPSHARSIDEAPRGIPVRSGSRAMLVAGIVAASVASLATGFAGGFIFGQRSGLSTESIDVSRHESVVEPQPTRAAIEDPKPIALSAQTMAPPQPTVPAVESGRLLVRSTPAGADVVVDGQSRGVTPLALGELAFRAHTIEVSHPGHDTRRQRVTLSQRRPARSVDFRLRPTSEPADSTAATDSTGSLQVASRPSAAQVFVDDTLIGTTPFLLSNVAAGSRRVRIELPGYKVWTTSVEIQPSARFRVSATLEP